MITTIVSDLGGVITTPLWDAFKVVQADFGIEPGALNAAMVGVSEELGAHPLHELECGRMTETEFNDGLARHLESAVGRPVPMHTFRETFWGALGRNEVVISLLESLRDEGYRMGLLTNNVREWEPHWRAMLDVDGLFSVVVDSAFVGMRKPDPEIYELTCSRLGVPPSECVLLDDFENNCQGAREAGMAAVVYREPEQAVRELRELLAERGAPGTAAA